MMSRHNGQYVANDSFDSIFLNETVWHLDQTFIKKYVPECLVDKKDSIDSGNGLVPNRRQAIIWTNDGQCTKHLLMH